MRNFGTVAQKMIKWSPVNWFSEKLALYMVLEKMPVNLLHNCRSVLSRMTFNYSPNSVLNLNLNLSICLIYKGAHYDIV